MVSYAPRPIFIGASIGLQIMKAFWNSFEVGVLAVVGCLFWIVLVCLEKQETGWGGIVKLYIGNEEVDDGAGC